MLLILGKDTMVWLNKQEVPQKIYATLCVLLFSFVVEKIRRNIEWVNAYFILENWVWVMTFFYRLSVHFFFYHKSSQENTKRRVTLRLFFSEQKRRVALRLFIPFLTLTRF